MQTYGCPERLLESIFLLLKSHNSNDLKQFTQFLISKHVLLKFTLSRLYHPLNEIESIMRNIEGVLNPQEVHLLTEAQELVATLLSDNGVSWVQYCLVTEEKCGNVKLDLLFLEEVGGVSYQ